MSINITVHSSQPPSSSSNNPFASLESVRKAENDKLRKTRLEQVRQQSKQLAAKVRRKVEIATQKEMANVDKLKQAEFKSWKQKHITKLQADYQHCLEDVGEAHKAAEAAEQCEIWFQERKATQQATAMLRGRQAEAKLAQNRESRKPKKRKEYKPTKSVAVQVSVSAEKPLQEQKKDLIVQEDESSSSVNTISAFEQFKKGSKANSAPDLRMQDRPLSPDFLSSDEDMPIGVGKNKENVPSHNTTSSKQRVDTLYYNPTSYTSPDTLEQNLPAASQMKPFTQVSEFIKRRREDRSHKPVPKDIPTYSSSQKNVQFDDLSENTLSFPTSTVMDRSILESPRKPVRKLVDQPKALPTKGGSPSKQSTTVSRSSGVDSRRTEPGTSKVQYYDYNTKYRKDYDQPASFVQRNEGAKKGELNAMQEAARLERLQNEMLIARRQAPAAPDHSKVALEKLQIRKDYENLQSELDKLVRAESQVKAKDVTTKPLMTETRQRQQSEVRQKRLNQAVEDLLKQRVLITCPVVRDPPKGVQLVSRPSQVNVAAGAGNAAHLPGDDSNLGAASSDSCSTILLGYEQGNTRAGIPLPETDKVAKLKELLEQINEQKKLLTEELKKEEEIEEELKVPLVKLKSTKTQTDNGIRKMQQRQQDLEQQQKNLHEKEREIRDLEKQLKEKLNRLEKEKSKPKVPPIHIDAKGSANTDIKTVLDSSSTGSNDSIQSGSDLPVKIVITVNDKSQKKVKKTPKKVVSEARRRKKAKDVIDSRPVEPPKAIPKSPSKAKAIAEKPIQVPEVLPEPEGSPISSTTSTIYRQLPNKIDNRVGHLLNQLTQSEVAKGTKPPPPPPTRRPESAPKHQLKKASAPPPAPLQAVHRQQRQNFNPNLMQYIVRLLGMSRHSIEQLGVSSSTTVSTPRDSVVNVSGNQSCVDEPTSRDQSRMDKLRRFIDENYNFLNEIDETLKEQELSGTADENISRVEDVWMKTLSRKEREIRREKVKSPPPPPVVERSPPVQESSLKSILKSPKKTPAKVAKIITPQGHVEVINLSDRDEQEALEKYSHLAESCSKRISELSDMIQKVREEKKKLIENSLSSSEQPESSTKYLDFPGKPPAVETSPQSAKDDPVSEEINNIFSNARQIGLSKDSGIAMSRPVTSSDYRDSPDTRPQNAGAPQFESSEDLSSREILPVAFEPLLKDIPKILPRLASIDVSSQPTANISKPHDSKEFPLSKRTKPPVAITRYSPQLEEATAAHELSTILEVETPMASKANISIPPTEKLDPAEQLLVEARDKLLEHARALGYEGFPNYQQYVREQNLEGTRFDPEKTCASRLNELLEVSDDKSDLRYQKFPVPPPEMNVTEETLNGKKPELDSNSSSSTSLPDVVAELKLRNIIDKSFDNSLDDSNRSTPNSASLEILLPHQQPNKSPTKKKQPDIPKTPNRSVSETTASLERDLNQLGLRWASTMLKKNQQALLQDHSSSSSLSPAEDMRRGSGRKPKPLPSLPNDPNDSLTASGKPLNLKEFIARELMIRTHSDLNSLSDSSSPCSLLLRSLLDISNINASTPELLTQTTTDRNVQRTSTPVATKSSSGGTPRENGADGGGTKDGSLNVTNGLFSGESRISSVHMSSSSGGENRLTTPNVRLDLDKYATSNKGKPDNGHNGRK